MSDLRDGYQQAAERLSETPVPRYWRVRAPTATVFANFWVGALTTTIRIERGDRVTLYSDNNGIVLSRNSREVLRAGPRWGPDPWVWLRWAYIARCLQTEPDPTIL